eukprot:14658037-Alexandrium_andersonii.AAC.1
MTPAQKPVGIPTSIGVHRAALERDESSGGSPTFQESNRIPPKISESNPPRALKGRVARHQDSARNCGG